MDYIKNISHEIFFHNISHGSWVYVKEIKDFTISGYEGCMLFDGYYREKELPQSMWSPFLSTSYIYEIYEKEHFEDTSEYCKEIIDDMEMTVCFTPTEIIKLKFRVIEQ